MNEYPKWMYHAVELPQIVADKEAEDKLGPDWSSTYIKQDWPKMIFPKDGGEGVIAANPDEAAAIEKGEKQAHPASHKAKTK